MANNGSQERPGAYANELAEAIYQTRTTISAVAEAVGIARPTLSEIVNGWRLPSAIELDVLVLHFGWSAAQLYPTQAFRDAIAATRKPVDEAGELIS